MSKRFLILFLSFSLILGSVTPCFAYDLATPSSINAKSLFAVSDAKATGDTVVAPSSSSYVGYYYTGSTISSWSGTLSSWGQIITHITDSISRSLQSVTLQIRPYIDQIEGYVDGLEGLIGTSNNHLQAIRSSLNYNNGSIGSDVYNINENIHDIHEILTSGGGIDVSLGSPWQPYFMPADNYDFNNNEWDYYYIRTVDEWGTVSSTSFTNTNILLGLKRLLVNLNNNNTYGFRNIANGVGGNNNSSFVPKIYNTDLTTKNASKISVWKSILEYGENTSMFLSRLAFVLASDEEISARQAAKDNADAVVDDFISSSGSGSVSTNDLGEMAVGSSAIKSALSSNASASDAFGVFNNDSSIWDWFTQGTKDSFDNVSRTRDSASYTSYYEDYISKVLQGVNENERR